MPSTLLTVIVKPLAALALGVPEPLIDGTQPLVVVPAVQKASADGSASNAPMSPELSGRGRPR